MCLECGKHRTGVVPVVVALGPVISSFPFNGLVIDETNDAVNVAFTCIL